MKLINILILVGTLSFTHLSAQQQPIELETIYADDAFSEKSVYGVNWMKDGRYYTALKNGEIIKYAITTGETVETIVSGTALVPQGSQTPIKISGYSFSPSENQLLISAEKESIYRRSSKAYFYVYDMQKKRLVKLAEGGKQSYATFSPDGTKVAFVRDNNLYYVSLADMQLHQVTTSGKVNEIINGSADWVYEEEFSMAQAFEWSPDGKNLAYFTFDETNVPEYNMQLWGELYPRDYVYKYPKAGEKNATVSITVFHLDEKKSVPIDLGDESDVYIPRIYWTTVRGLLSIIKINRLQNKLEIYHADVNNGKAKRILLEESETYVDLDYNDNLQYLKDGKSFIRTSEKDGYKHIYHHRMDGTLLKQVTKGKYEVTSLVGIDEQRNLIYYVSTEDAPIQRQLFSIKLSGKGKQKLTLQEGVHNINMNPDFTYFIDSHSSSEHPLQVTLHRAPTGEMIKVLEDNQALKTRLDQYNYQTKEFFDFEIGDGTLLHGYMIKPPTMDASKKYPVLMYVYGGPGSQQVMDQWGGTREAWFNHLAQQGYIVACIDNRGTGGRGKAFKHITYAQLGKYEVEDQIAGAKYLGSLPYIDADRIGIWGWSYGGYMSSLALMKGADVFKAAIAVAPVTNWRFYDTIYTERYLKTPQENPGGYDDNSPVTHVDKLKGSLLLVHGTGDDNVHFQNAVALEDALIAAGKQFQTFYYPNRSHGISGGNTSLHLHQMMTRFILNNL